MVILACYRSYNKNSQQKAKFQRSHNMKTGYAIQTSNELLRAMEHPPPPSIELLCFIWIFNTFSLVSFGLKCLRRYAM